MINYLQRGYNRVFLKEDEQGTIANKNKSLPKKASESDVIDAIDNRERVLIHYKTKGKDKHTGSRVIEVHAYGLTMAGNPVIRAFQPFGDTTTNVPKWKYFRLDRIIDWQPTGQVFTLPASKRYRGIGDFNPDTDKTMGTVYKIVKFDNNLTDRENELVAARSQMANPINIGQIRDKYGYLGSKERDAISQTAQNSPRVGSQFNRSVNDLENIVDKYDNNISSKFVSDKYIKTKLGYPEDAPMTDELKKKIQMYRSWMELDKSNARQMRKYQQSVLDDEGDEAGKRAMSKLNSLSNLNNWGRSDSEIINEPEEYDQEEDDEI